MRFSVNDMQWNLAAGPGDAVASESFSTLDRVFDLDGPRVSHGGLCHVIKLHLGGRDYYVKRYQNRGKHLLKAFGRNRAATEHHNLAYFARLGIPVPRVVAYGGVRHHAAGGRLHPAHPQGRLHAQRPEMAERSGRDLAGLDRLGRRYLSRPMRLRFYLWYRNRTHLTREDRRLIAKIVTYHNRR